MLLAAEPGLVVQQPARRIKAGRVAVDDQLAAPRKIEIDVVPIEEGAHAVARMKGQPQQLARGRIAARGIAGADEGGQPAPLGRVQPRAPAQRRVAAQQPAGHLGQHAGTGQRRHIAVAELPAVGEAGLQPRTVAPLQHRDLMAVVGQLPGGGHADHAGAGDHHLHCRIRPYRFAMPQG